MGRSRSRGKSGRSKGQIGSVVIGLVIAAVLGLSSGEFQNDRNANDTQVESSQESSQVESSQVESSQVESSQESSKETPDDSEQGAGFGQTESSNLEVHFIDVGQGDATLIKADGKYMLIDAGDNSKGTAVQSYLQKQGVKKLDYLVLTHTDADHIGGADVIVTKFDIGEIFLADYKKNNATYRDLMSAISYKRLTYSTPEVGSVYTLGNATFQIIAPVKKYDNPNDYSIGLILKHGENTFLFTGDAEGPAEADILKTGIDLDIDVYQAGHHGSRSSSDRDFLEAMTPEYAVISCKEDNSYGHPHAQTLNSLRAMKVKVFRTDEQGSIVAYSDGTEITWNCAPSETWQAGEPKGN